jgi:LPXTG-site transpeptidase (sortase) family protein
MRSFTKPPRILLVSLLVAIALLSTISVAMALNGYATITVDSTGDVGFYTSLALNSSGYPVISYHDDTNSALKVAVCNDATCSSPTLTTVDNTASVGEYTSLELNSSGYPVISYFDDTNTALKVAVCNDATCTSPTLTTVDSTGYVGLHNSLALNSSGYPVISYYDSSNTALKVAVCNDATCTSPTLTTVDSAGVVGYYNSLALNSSGYPVISYWDGTNNDLKLAVCNDATCTSPTLTTVDSADVVGQFTSLALNGSGYYPVISYYDVTNTALKVAVCNDATCTSPTLTTVDSTGVVGYYNSLALNGSGYPMISYWDLTNFDLKVAVCNDATCTSKTLTTVDSTGYVGYFTSLALNNDKPVISYYDATNGDLKVAVPQDATAPTVSSVSSTKTNGTYGTGTTIDVTVQFSESVTVTGTPQLTLETGTSDAVVDYTSGSGSDTLTFQYTVAAGHTSADLDYVATTSLALNSGTIKDAAGNNATLTLASPGATNSLGANKALVIDTTAPTVTIEEGSSQPDPTDSSPISFDVKFSESVTGFDQSDINISGMAGTPTINVSGSGDTYTVTVSGMADGETVTATIPADAAQDSAGNKSLASTSTDNSVTYDTRTPEIDVQRPAATSIADGGTDALANQAVGTVNLTYTIDNSAGTDQLTVTGVSADNYSNSSGFSSSTTFPLNISAGDTDTIDISFDVYAVGAFSFDMDIASNDADEATYDIAVEGTGVDVPVVTFGVNTIPANNASLSTGPSEILVEFNEDMEDDGGENAANNTANYVLVEVGTNGTFDTTACDNSPLPGGDDTEITINSATYDGSDPFVTTLGINGGTALPAGDYRLFVCGTTSVYSAAGVVLNGSADVDSTLSFSVQAAANTGGANNTASALPATGFAMGEVTTLPHQPAAKAYTDTAMTLDIPKLGVSTPIVGVSQSSGEWDVTWLGNSAGYLYGSAFPTWAGNTVITGHVWDAYNQPGIFAELKTLKYGDQVQIQAWGQTYTYEVRESKLVTKKNTNVVFQSEQYDWLTLVTCEFYNPFNGEYLFRRAVRAVLVSVQ